MESGSDTLPRLSRRERNKQEKLQRIKKAAFELFQERGYERATTQEIADRADVSSGTLFFYAKTKEDLLGIVMAGDILETVARARASVPAGRSAPEQLTHLFTRLLRHHARHKELSQYFLQDSLRERGSHQSAEMKRVRNQVIAAAEEIIALEQRSKRINSTPSVHEIAYMCFWLFYGVLQSLVNSSLSLRQCSQVLLRSYQILWKGLQS